MKNDLRAEKIAITGASGWLGRELMELLLQEYGSEWVSNSMFAFGSKLRQLELSDGTRVEVDDLMNWRKLPEIQGIVHLAFLTRDKSKNRSLGDYASQNLAVTSQIVQMVNSKSPKWVATVSSGAVFSSGGRNKETYFEGNPYGFLKRVEEGLLIEVCNEMGANLAIGRLWAAGGLEMPLNNGYALSDFIQSALDRKVIEIKSKHAVYRSYCDARQFMDVLVKQATSIKLSIFDSGGEVVEIEELAHRVGFETGASVIQRNQELGGSPDSYLPLADEFLTLLKNHSLTPKTLDEIVAITISGHRIAMSRRQTTS